MKYVATTIPDDANDLRGWLEAVVAQGRAAELAEQDYRSDKALTGFDAFSEEELDDDEPDSA